MICVITQSTPARAEAELRQVHIVLVGKLAGQPSLPERFTSWFDVAKYRVSVREEPVLDTAQVLSPPRDAAVYVWATLRKDTQARLYFATAKADGTSSYSLREVTLDSGLDELGAERLSQIVHLSVLALFEGQGEHERVHVARMLDDEPAAKPAVGAPAPVAPAPVAPSPPRAPPSTPKPVEQASDRDRRFEFGVGYAVSPRSEEGLWHGPAVHATRGFESGLLFELEVQGFVPHEQDISSVRLRFWGVGMGVGGGWGMRWGEGWGVSGALGPRVEVVSYEPRESLAEEVTLSEGDTELRPELGMTLRLRVGGAGLGAGLFARLAYALTRTHYDVRTDTSTREIAAPSRFLPTAGLELTF